MIKAYPRMANTAVRLSDESSKIPKREMRITIRISAKMVMLRKVLGRDFQK